MKISLMILPGLMRGLEPSLLQQPIPILLIIGIVNRDQLWYFFVPAELHEQFWRWLALTVIHDVIILSSICKREIIGQGMEQLLWYFLKSCLLYLMKLQRFIENYRRDRCDRIVSPDRSGMFRTSESIGTLNSRDEAATDRSFAIKEIPIHCHLSAHKRENTQEVEHLRELCESERPSNGKVRENECLQTIEEFTYQSHPQEVLVAIFSKPSKLPLPKPTFSFRPETAEEINDDLYEEAPSKQEEETTDKLICLLNYQQQQFLSQYEALMSRAQRLQEENILLEELWLEQEKLSLHYQYGRQQLQQQVHQLKERVTHTIQENIEIQNMIKQILLKQEMQKYRYFTKDQSRKIVKKENSVTRLRHGV